MSTPTATDGERMARVTALAPGLAWHITVRRSTGTIAVRLRTTGRKPREVQMAATPIDLIRPQGPVKAVLAMMERCLDDYAREGDKSTLIDRWADQIREAFPEATLEVDRG